MGGVTLRPRPCADGGEVTQPPVDDDKGDILRPLEDGSKALQPCADGGEAPHANGGKTPRPCVDVGEVQRPHAAIS